MDPPTHRFTKTKQPTRGARFPNRKVGAPTYLKKSRQTPPKDAFYESLNFEFSVMLYRNRISSLKLMS